MTRGKRLIGAAAAMAVAAVALIGAGCLGGGGSGGGGSTPSSPSAPASPKESYAPPHTKPGPAVDKIVFSSHGVDQAAVAIRNNEIDVYLFGLKLSAAQELEGAKDIRMYRAPAGSVSILLNPAPGRDGELNPFSLPEVRRAMNYLINFEYIAQDLYGGYAVPQTSHVSKLDYDYLAVAGTVAEEGIRYDFDYAKREIAKAMEQAGAELINGKWHYRGEPIRLKFVIRTEDERFDVGHEIRTNLESVGFEVTPVGLEFAAAISKVYTSDPKVFDWHLYTEGWGRGSAERYDYASLNQFTAPWMANMPGWQIFGFWQYENPKLDEMGKKIFTGIFTNKEERDAIYREATKLAMDESVRLWVVTTYNTFPAKQNLSGVTEDVVSGPKSILTLREAFVPGQDTLRVGTLHVWTERSVWNLVGGFDDVYSTDIWKNLVDPAIINDPFRGVPIPFRANFDVETAGPTSKMTVPDGVVMWNAEKDQWEAVPSGTQATSKVVFDFSKYFQSTWHDGQPITMADVLYNIASTFERTYDSEKRQFEFVLAATQKPALDLFRGFRIVDENRIEVYLDYWHFHEDYIASYANIAAPAMPWEVLAASDALVFEKRLYAYSKSAAARYANGKQLSLVVKNDAVYVANVLKEFVRSSDVPAGVFTVNGTNYVTATDAQARYQATLDWFEKYQHLVISNGPFFLTRFDPAAQYAELQAFRHQTYPFKPGDWYRASPKPIQFVNVDVPRADTSRTNTVTVTLDGPGALELHYVVVDPESGMVVDSGIATKASSGEFAIELPSVLLQGFRGKLLTITLLASSDELVLVNEERVDISVP